jgi:hypothetical protein
VAINNVNGDTLTIDSSGASHIKAEGKTASLDLDISGASSVDATALTVSDASVDASGASHVDLMVTERLNAEASGASTVSYKGSPSTVVKDVSGAGSVSAK